MELLLQDQIYIVSGSLAVVGVVLLIFCIALCVSVSRLKRVIKELKDKATEKSENKYAYNNPSIQPDEELYQRGYLMHKGQMVPRLTRDDAERIRQQAQQGEMLQAQQQALQQAQQLTLQQREKEQYALQQSQQAEVSKHIQQQALQWAQQQALQQAQRHALEQQVQRQAEQQGLQQVEQQKLQHLPQFNSFRYYNRPNVYNGRTFNNMHTEYVTPSSLPMNEISKPHMQNYNQEFIDGIVEKVIEKTQSSSNLILPTTKKDIEKIVSEILLEHSMNSRDASGMNANANYENLSNNKRVNQNPNAFPHYSEGYSPQNAKPTATYPDIQTEHSNPLAECVLDSGGLQNSYSSGEPIAIAVPKVLYAPNRTIDPRILANSFTYTSV